MIRLTASDLNRLVKRIISESPFDMDSIDKITPDDSDDEMNRKFSDIQSKKSIYDEFEKSDLRKLLADTEILLAIAKDYCKNYLYDDRPHQYCNQLDYIEKRIDKYHSVKYSKRHILPTQPILPSLVARRKQQ